MLVIARPRRGTVGERGRVAHLFIGKADAEALVALCEREFQPGDLEWLDRVRGMPCEQCLMRSPSPERTPEVALIGSGVER